MKNRILPVIFAAFMLSACAFGFAACGEQTTVGTPQDNETEQGSNGNNTQGGETDDPQGGDEPVVRTTVTEEEWNAALSLEGIHNVTVALSIRVNTMNYISYTCQFDNFNWYFAARNWQLEFDVVGFVEILEIDHEDAYKTNMDELYCGFYTLNGYSQDEEGQWIKELGQIPWSQFAPVHAMGMFLGCVKMPWNDFEYDEITSQYKIENATFESIDNADTITDFDSVMLKFENGKLINYEAQYHEPSYPEDTFYISMSFSDYGTTSVTLPEVSAE